MRDADGARELQGDRALGVRGMFPVVVSGVEVAHGEPEPGIFLEAASRLGVVPGQCVVVEDSRNGLLAAKRAGMRCVAVPSPPTRTQSFTEADVTLTALPELLALSELAARRAEVSRPRQACSKGR